MLCVLSLRRLARVELQLCTLRAAGRNSCRTRPQKADGGLRAARAARRVLHRGKGDRRRLGLDKGSFERTTPTQVRAETITQTHASIIGSLCVCVCVRFTPRNQRSPVPPRRASMSNDFASSLAMFVIWPDILLCSMICSNCPLCFLTAAAAGAAAGKTTCAVSRISDQCMWPHALWDRTQGWLHTLVDKPHPCTPLCA